MNNDIIKKIHTIINENGFNNASKISKIFRNVDINQDGIIDSKTDLHKLLKEMGITINEAERRSLIRTMKSTDDKITLDMIFSILMPNLSQEKRIIVEKAFNSLDIDKNGFVLISDLESRFQSLNTVKIGNRTLSKQYFIDEISKLFDHDRDGKITFRDFEFFYIELDKHINSIDEWNQIISSSWNL